MITIAKIAEEAASVLDARWLLYNSDVSVPLDKTELFDVTEIIERAIKQALRAHNKKALV